jgi:hypothetical protein
VVSAVSAVSEELAALAVWAELAVLVESAELAESVAWVESAEPAESVAWVEPAEWVVQAVSAVPAASVDPAVRAALPSPARAVPRVRAAPAAATARGITIPSIEAVRPMEIGRRRTASAAAPEVLPLQRVKRAHASRSVIRGEIFRVTATAQAALA